MQNILYKWLILLSTEVFMNTGEKIRKYRMEKNLSQVELSSILLVSRQTISNWENG
ncbi:helix-turn-helix transcriptional regulator, partial [Enterococcus faecalis]|nr:helix-turn-helix transcriptional regulator [Enterococcus faecalis]